MRHEKNNDDSSKSISFAQRLDELIKEVGGLEALKMRRGMRASRKERHKSIFKSREELLLITDQPIKRSHKKVGIVTRMITSVDTRRRTMKEKNLR